MGKNVKPVDSLTVSDIKIHPVWQYAPGKGDDETAVEPVAKVPVATLSNRVVGTQVTLANGSQVWALIGNVETKDARQTRHFLMLSVARKGSWFTLARYYDIDIRRNGPAALAKFLGLGIDEVFPIAYDLRPYSKGDVAALTGEITAKPRERLTEAELISMAVK